MQILFSQCDKEHMTEEGQNAKNAPKKVYSVHKISRLPILKLMTTSYRVVTKTATIY